MEKDIPCKWKSKDFDFHMHGILISDEIDLLISDMIDFKIQTVTRDK